MRPGQIIEREGDLLAVEVELEHPIDRLADNCELVKRGAEQSLL